MLALQLAGGLETKTPETGCNWDALLEGSILLPSFLPFLVPRTECNSQSSGRHLRTEQGSHLREEEEIKRESLGI